MKSRVYHLGESTLTLAFGDLTTSKAQVLVSSDDDYLTMGGGVSAALLRAGGNAITLDVAKKVPAKLGDVIVTTAGSLPAQYIFHAVTLAGPRELTGEPSADLVYQLTERCLHLLDTLNLTSIAFPALGTGVADLSYEEVAAQMAAAIIDNAAKRRRRIDATIYLFDRHGQMDPIEFISFFEEIATRVPRLGEAARRPSAPRQEEQPATAELDTEEEVRRKRVNHLRTLLGSLEDQRFKLEERLVQLIGANGHQEDVAELRSKLRENEDLRLHYMAEASGRTEQFPLAGQARKPQTVFVSSTYLDLVQHRLRIKDEITKSQLLFRGMEHFGADPGSVPAALIVEEVKKADVYIGVFGVRYGSIDTATGLSMTELEYNAAESSGKPMLVYVIRGDAPVKVSDIEANPSGKEKLDALKRRILARKVVYQFVSEDDLAHQVYVDLAKLKPPQGGT